MGRCAQAQDPAPAPVAAAPEARVVSGGWATYITRQRWARAM